MTKERRPNSKEKQTKNQLMAVYVFFVFVFFVFCFYKLKMEVLRTSVACIPSSFRVICSSREATCEKSWREHRGLKSHGSKTAQCCALQMDADFIWSTTFISEVLVIVIHESWDGLKQLAGVRQAPEVNTLMLFVGRGRCR